MGASNRALNKKYVTLGTKSTNEADDAKYYRLQQCGEENTQPTHFWTTIIALRDLVLAIKIVGIVESSSLSDKRNVNELRLLSCPAGK